MKTLVEDFFEAIGQRNGKTAKAILRDKAFD
jgi:hypothetical protein